MEFKIKNILPVASIVVLVAWFVYYLKSNASDFSQLSLVNPTFLVILLALFLFNLFLTGILNRELLKPLKVKLSLLESFALSAVTGFYNLATPFRGGAIVRAAYLKKKHNFPYVHFLATLSAIYVLVFLVASFLGILSTVLIYRSTGVFSWFLFWIFWAIFLALLAIAVFSPKFREGKNKWANRFIKVINGWHLIKNNHRVIFVTSFITLLQILLSSLMLWLQFRVFGVEISFVACLFLSTIGNLSMLVAITPGNLGINEAIVVFSALTIGIAPAESLSAALLGRAVSLVVLFVLGPIFSYVLLKKTPNNSGRKK